MNDTLREIKKQTNAAHISAAGSLTAGVAAAVQAGITEKAMDASIEASRLDQRAWVGPSPIIITPPGVPSPGSDIQVSILNSGRTPGPERLGYQRHVSPSGGLYPQCRRREMDQENRDSQTGE